MTSTVDIDETAKEFLTERRDFLHVFVVPSPSGAGFDVVCRIDGTYTFEGAAVAAAEGIRDAMENLEDVPMEGRIWWAGPPE